MNLHRVLVVDDDNLISMALGRGLEQGGYSVTTAEDGAQAIAVFEKETFDVVVVDLIMREIDGLGVLKRCKELRPETLVIILTGYGDFASAVEALRLGADDYITKPCDAGNLSTRIERCAEQRRPRSGGGKSLASTELLLRETHHRLKNDLLMLSALVGLQLPYVNDAADRVLFEELRTRVQTMALIHEELYRGRSYEQIEASPFFSELSRRTIRTFNPHRAAVSVHVDADEERLPTETAIALGLIVDEFLTNSMKYAFEPGGEGLIEVSFRRQGDEYLLSVHDNGKGLEADTPIEEASTLGMRIIVALTSQLRGTLNYRSEGGAHFSIAFPARAS